MFFASSVCGFCEFLAFGFCGRSFKHQPQQSQQLSQQEQHRHGQQDKANEITGKDALDRPSQHLRLVVRNRCEYRVYQMLQRPSQMTKISSTVLQNIHELRTPQPHPALIKCTASILSPKTLQLPFKVIESSSGESIRKCSKTMEDQWHTYKTKRR